MQAGWGGVGGGAVLLRSDGESIAPSIRKCPAGESGSQGLSALVMMRVGGGRCEKKGGKRCLEEKLVIRGPTAGLGVRDDGGWGKGVGSFSGGGFLARRRGTNEQSLLKMFWRVKSRRVWSKAQAIPCFRSAIADTNEQCKGKGMGGSRVGARLAPKNVALHSG